MSDLEAIANYVAQDSPAYAAVVVRTIVSRAKMLSPFPRSGRKVPEFGGEKIRELLAFSYRIIYEHQESHVLIVAIIDGKRLLQ